MNEPSTALAWLARVSRHGASLPKEGLSPGKVMMVAHRTTMVCPPCTGVALGCPARPTGALWSEASRVLGLPERPTPPARDAPHPETPPHARGISSDAPGSSARVVTPPGIVSKVALRSGRCVCADRHRGPPCPTTTGTPWPLRGSWLLTSRQTPTRPRVSKNAVFGLNLLPGFWTRQYRSQCRFSLDFEQIREVQKPGKGNWPI